MPAKMNNKRKSLSQPSTSRSSNPKRSKSNNKIKGVDLRAKSLPDLHGRAGRVLRVYMKNFMCHSSLEITFDPNTNYIVGRNGSGKSAVLAALIVGLGGKASFTNRGSSVKAFIKMAQPSAMVEITLSNTGSMAYSPHIFGDHITVVRTLTASGQNSYKIKAATGQIIYTSFKDLNKITNALNIYVDNPVCILNQDVARTFLNTNDPKKKYIMFMKATNLENLKFHYKLAVQNRKETISLLNAKLQALAAMKDEVRKWYKKYSALERMSETETKLKNLEVEAIWAQIISIEEELNSKRELVEKVTKEIEEFSDLIRSKADRETQLNQNIEQIRQQLVEIRNEEQNNQEAMNLKKGNLHRLKETLVGKKSDVTNIENVIKRKKIDKERLDTEINNSSSFQTDRLKVIQERDTKISSLEQTLLQISKLSETTENSLKQTNQALTLKQQEVNDIKNELSELSGNIKQKEARIRSMKVNENNAVSIYGSHMQRILESITASKEQFQQLPRGPIGSYITLKDKKWALAVEDFVSHGTLMSFCVDNHADAKVLTRIFTNICTKNKPTIICSKFHSKVHNYLSYKVDAPKGCNAMIDALIIKDPIILNCLIDQLSIETVLLISSNELARELMSNESRVPKNCSRAITLCGDQFYPDPNYRSYSCRNKIARYLQVSTTEAIRLNEEELQNLLKKQKTIQQQTNAISEHANKLNNELKVLQNKMSKLDGAQSKVQRELNDVKLQHLPAEPNIKILTEELGEVSKILASKETDLEKIIKEQMQIEMQIKDAESQFDALKQTSKGLENRMKPLITELTESESKLKQININSKFHSDKIKQCSEKVKTAKKDYDKQKEDLTEKLEAAENVGSRVETNRTLNTIVAELEETQQQFANIKASIGNKEHISNTYETLKTQYDKVKNDLDNIQLSLNGINKSIDERVRNYKKLTNFMGYRVREMFTGVLEFRQFTGTIEINHEEQTLELIVKPHHSSSQGSGQTHILSGGERSYTTVAFLHALWQVMEYPFYFLDEFDVFMDKVNRRIVMDILLDHAKEHKDQQFVFLTPQDISSVIGDKNITVHKMEDPRPGSN